MKATRNPGKSLKFFAAGCAAAIVALALPDQPATAQQKVAGIDVFPPNNVWNLRVDNLPVDKNSATYVSSMTSLNSNIHPDFGSIYGIPYNVVSGPPSATQSYDFHYVDESDPGPYPQITNPTTKIEGGWNADPGEDRHILLVDTSNYVLYEFYQVHSATPSLVSAEGGSIFPLSSNALRPDTWTSADAAGLPIFPGLVNYAEASAGPIKHAFRFTSYYYGGNYIWPARHRVSSKIRAGFPPFGQRFRLKKSVNVNAITQWPEIRNVLTALKEYGMFLADLGTTWYISGAEDPSWVDNHVDDLKKLKGSDFEAVDESAYMVSPDSALASLKKPKPKPVIPVRPWPTFK